MVYKALCKEYASPGRRQVSSSGMGRVNRKGHGHFFFAFAMLCATASVLLASGCDPLYIKVDGVGIKKSEFIKELDTRLERARKKNPLEISGIKGKRLLAETKRQVATEIIKRTILAVAARKLGVAVTDREVERRLAEEKKNFLDKQEDRKLLSASREELRKRIADIILLEKISEKISKGVEVTEEEAESFYLTRTEKYSNPPMVHMAHILVRTEGEGKIALERINAGEEFSAVAASMSRDDGSKAFGGDVGWVVSGTWDPRIENVAFSMQPGEVKGPVKASDGYHVIKVIERREARVLTYEEVRDKVMRDVLIEKKQEILSDWLKTVYANAVVRLPRELGRWDPLLGIVVEE